MQLHQALMLLALPLLALANPLQLTLSINDGDEVVRPKWERDDRSRIVPMTEYARTDLVDPLVEEGLIALVGPRFANAFYTNDSESVTGGISVTCITKCGVTIAKALPCIYTAIKNHRPKDILKCAANKKTLCGCDKCLPSPINTLVQKEICSKSTILDTEGDDTVSPYVDFMAVGSNSVGIQAFRGDLYEYQVEEMKALNAHGASFTKQDGDVHAMCTIGDGCGGCNCCVGGCVFDTCVGVCAA